MYCGMFVSKTILGWNNSVITCKNDKRELCIKRSKTLDKEDKREMGQ